MSTQPVRTPQAHVEAPDKGVGCDALLAGLQDAITEARSLESNTDSLVDAILTPLIAEARRLAAYIEELEGNYGAEMARADNAHVALEDIKRLSWHCIPHYAYGDNQAACEMGDRLNNICTAAEQILSANSDSGKNGG